MKKAEVFLSFSLDTECPYCHKEFDIDEYDDEGYYSYPIFNNNWGVLEDKEVECPECQKIFLIEQIVY